MRKLIVTIVVALSMVVGLSQAVMPETPRAVVDVTYNEPSNRVNVPAGASLQAALASAAPNTTLVLQGSAYGAITLPSRPAGSGWIYVVPSTVLPAPGSRVVPGDAAKLWKITQSAGRCVASAAGANHIRLVGMECSLTGSWTSDVVDISGSFNILDRSYVHGVSANSTQRRGIVMNGSNLAVVDSYIEDFKENGSDSQAIWTKTGPGPMLVKNSYLQAASENWMCGGEDPSGGVSPADITIVGNHFFKPLAWKSRALQVKNLIEFKNCTRVLVQGNIFENNWVGSDQHGAAIIFTPRNQNGGCPQCTVQDVTFRYNEILNTVRGVTIAGEDDNRPAQPLARVLLEDNRWQITDLGGQGRGLDINKGPDDVRFNHNTWVSVGSFGFSENFPKALGFVFTNNIIEHGWYGFTGTNTNPGNPTLTAYYTNPVFTSNAIIGGQSTPYPSGNVYPASVAAASLVQGNDGRVLGVDVTKLSEALACTRSGQCGNAPPPSDTTPPVVTITSPTSGTAVIVGAQLVLTATAVDEKPGVGGTSFTVNGVAASSPYLTTTVGTLSIVASAVDAAGNRGTSSPSLVTVNAAPLPPRDCTWKPWVVTVEALAPNVEREIRFREIDLPEANGGAPCTGSFSETTVRVKR